MSLSDVLCDSSSLISLTGSCLDNALYFLKDEFNVRFLIPPSVEHECVTLPLSRGLKEHAFSARKIEKMISDSILYRTQKEASNTNQLLDSANNLFFIRGKPLPLVHKGEAEVLAYANESSITTVLVDERTTRMLIEAPFRIKEHLEIEFNVNIMVDRNSLSYLSDFTKNFEVIRATELLVLAYENGFMDRFGRTRKDALEAALYKLKYAGCSIRFDEIAGFINSI